jgi:cytochrome c553
MSDPRISEPHVLDQPWRVWASIAVIGILLFGVLLGILIIPIVQGRSAGLDAYTAICRALGILPGSPAQPQPATTASPSPVSQVVWTPGVLEILARGNTERGRAKVLEVCVARHGEQGVSTTPDYPHLNGQSGAAIYKQLHDYRTGSRASVAFSVAYVIAQIAWHAVPTSVYDGGSKVCFDVDQIPSTPFVSFWHKADMPACRSLSAFGGKADNICAF